MKVLELDPENKAAKNKVTICQHQIKAQRDKEKRTFANMFDRLVHVFASHLSRLLNKIKNISTTSNFHVC